MKHYSLLSVLFLIVIIVFSFSCDPGDIPIIFYKNALYGPSTNDTEMALHYLRMNGSKNAEAELHKFILHNEEASTGYKTFALEVLSAFPSDKTMAVLETCLYNNDYWIKKAALNTYIYLNGEKPRIAQVMKQLTDEGHNGFPRFVNTDGKLKFDPYFLPTFKYLLAHLRKDSYKMQLIGYLDYFGYGPIVQELYLEIMAKVKAGKYSPHEQKEIIHFNSSVEYNRIQRQKGQR